MNNINLKPKKVILILSLLILISSSILTIFPSKLSISEDFNKKTEDDSKHNILHPFLSNSIGEDPWWNASFQWRQCINISNPGSYNLEDNIIEIQFNWKNLYDAGHLQDDLDDIRIVENGELRNYYLKKDFPSADWATIWFEVNSTAGSMDSDTYMYYGNSTVGRAENNYMDYCPNGIARWDFEEGSGNMAYDSMSNLYHGTIIGDTSYIATPELEGGYALTFDGDYDYIALNMSYNYQGADPDYDVTTLNGGIYRFTASAWVRIGLDLGGWSILDFDRSEYFTFAAGTPGYLATDGHVEFDTSPDSGSGGSTHDMNGITLIDEDTPPAWHHVVVSFDYSRAMNKKIYVDGVLDREVDAWSTIGNLYIGDILETRFGFIGTGSEATVFDGDSNGKQSGYWFEGAMDDVRYFDYALSDKEIEWLANYYTLVVTLLGEVERAATVTINVKDADDRLVPEAEVSLWKNNTHVLTVDNTPYTQFTLLDGSTEFSQVPFGSYNITVNYTLYNGLDEKIVYDSRTGPGGEVEFKGLFVSTNITVDLWTIDFEVDDWAGDSLNYGQVNVGNSTHPLIDSIPLDSAGEATFRWLTTTSYNYSIYYNNPDYYTHPTLLNTSDIVRGVSSYYQYVRTNMSKLEIRVMDETGTEGVTGVTIKVQLNGTTQDVVDLQTDTDGYGHGDFTTDFGFWYLNDQVYNFTLWIIGQKQLFKVNTSDKFKPVLTDYYNYTLDQASTLVFWLDGLNFTQRIANFSSATGVSSVVWGQNMTFSVLYETSDDSGKSWFADWNRLGFTTAATWTIYSKYGVKLLELSMAQGLTTGTFTITINSSLFSAAYEYEFYYVLISGYKPFWNDPEDVYFGIYIYAKPTGLTLHDYTSMPDELPKNIGGDYEISEFYGFAVNITARFYDVSSGSALTPETFTYDWDYGSGLLISGPLPGYYTFELDTSDAVNVGKYRIDLSATLENHSQFEDFGMYINILSRPTRINESTGILYVPDEIFIFKPMNYTFQYIDILSSSPIVDTVDEKSFVLQKLDNGVPIPGTTETGELIITADDYFVLDINTETREDGEYSIIVTLDKLNYEPRIAIISLTILKRNIDIALPEPPFIGSKIEIASGAALRFNITLTDPNNETSPGFYAPIIGASVYLTIGNNNYSTVNGYITDHGDGSYTVTAPALADAFFMPETFTAKFTIEKQYFSKKEESITIVVKMQEIFGIPTFYFLMIVGSIVAVAGSLATYRLVQQRRIPTFVKKARSMKKSIKGKKGISESVLYPSKEEYIVKKLGDKWTVLGLSLDDIMGVKEKKKKKLFEGQEEFKGGAV